MGIVPSAAKEKNQDKDDKNRAHDNASRQFLIAPVEPGCINYFFRMSRTASLTLPTAFWILPSAWSDLPSLCNFESPSALPTAVFAARLISLIEPATLFLSKAALLAYCEDT